MNTSQLDWTFVGDMIAAATLVLTIIALVVAMVALTNQLRATYSVDNVWRFKDEWDGREMIAARRTVAKMLLDESGRKLIDRRTLEQRIGHAEGNPDVLRIVDFFMTIEYLVGRRAIQIEAVWALLGYYAIYWTTAILSARSPADFISFGSLHSLRSRLSRVQHTRRRIGRRPVADKEWIELTPSFLAIEARLDSDHPTSYLGHAMSPMRPTNVDSDQR